ncbi:MAG: substrate-binding domain-containing protein, partial [Frankiales bacterium]|nr:substrate-binding domain-containing protein [Frankiales bacterium]
VLASTKKPIAYVTTKSGHCKHGYQKATLHSGKGAKRKTVYVCVLQVTKTVYKTKTSPYHAANATLVGSGSNTAYGAIAGISDVFNGLLGCNPIAPASQVQPLDFSCPPGSLNSLTGSATENPLNDVSVIEPAIGGSAGVQQLQYQGAHLATYTGGKVAPINFTTTVSSPSASNLQGLNFVGFAQDGLSWFHFTSVDGTATPSATVTDLSLSQLQGIWNGTITTWGQVNGNSSDTSPIKVYTASAGAGVRSVWEKYLGESAGGSSTYIESQGSTYANSHIIPQNEDQKILANGDAANAIFFFSVGRFNVLCGSAGTNAACTDGNAGTSVAIGNIAGVAPTAANIYSKTYAPTLSLYTVYSNGSNPNIPVATQPTLNFISEDGFLCKPNTSEVDPNTGYTVRQEIDTAILRNGFLPLDHATLGSNGVADESSIIAPFSEDTGVTHPASITASPYAAHDLSGSSPTGYCKVSTTDTVSSTQ